MPKHETEIWHGNHAGTLMAWIEIDFEYLPAEHDGLDYVDAKIVIHEVRVLAVEGYGARGNIVYNRRRNSIDPDWLEFLDTKFYNIVENEVAAWTHLAMELEGVSS